jgi:hypothetical protein
MNFRPLAGQLITLISGLLGKLIAPNARPGEGFGQRTFGAAALRFLNSYPAMQHIDIGPNYDR